MKKMRIVNDFIEISTMGNTDIINITDEVFELVQKSGLKRGNIVVFISGSTAGVTSIEYEPGLIKDLPEILEKIAPSTIQYHHDKTWGDGNGYAHIRAALVGASFTIPFENGKPLLGTWQQIVVLDFDNRPRKRKITIQMIGE